MPAFGRALTAGLAARDLWATHDEFRWSSSLGTFDFNHLSHFLTDNPLPQGKPWAGRTTKNTNYYQDTPNTGVTRHYTWTISREPCNPDGLYENTCLLVNGQFPGPTIEANWGDYIEVTVTNEIPDEGTSIHWHGLLQKGTPYMDGVPGNSQCPIAPGKTFTYRFQADLYGTTWYHSHWSAQFSSGLTGPIVIYGPYDNVQYDADLGPVMISDYFWSYYEPLVALTLAPPDQARPPLANNNLINGKASNGTTGLATFSVQSGKTYRMRLINNSGASTQKFSIDGYTVTIFANDFVPVQPYDTDVVTLNVGQRTDILFKASGKPTDSVWMRGFRPPNCGPSAGGELVLAAIFYENADTSQMPTTEPGANALNTDCGNDPLSDTVPYYPMPAEDPDYTEVIEIAFRPNGTALLWYMNDETFRIDYNDPLLLEAKLGNLDFAPIRSVHNYGTNKTVRFVLENPVAQPHPMHLHGHNIQVLQEGPCNPVSSATPAPSSSAEATFSLPQPSHYSAPSGVTPSGSWTSQPPGSYSTAAPASSESESPEPSGSPSGSPSSPPEYSRSPTSSAAAPSYPASSPSSAAAPSYPASTSSSSAAPPAYSSPPQKRDSTTGRCWDGSIVNPENPQRRDVQMLEANSYIVIQYTQDNPGVWPLHCHIAWHLSAGMNWMVLEQPDEITDVMSIPSIMAQTCRDWSAYTDVNVVKQIDDGI